VPPFLLFLHYVLFPLRPNRRHGCSSFPIWRRPFPPQRASLFFEKVAYFSLTDRFTIGKFHFL